MNKNNLIKILIVLILFIGSIFYFGFYNSNNNIKILKTTVSTDLLNDKLERFKVIVFSDIKYNGEDNKIEEAVKLINNQDPDIVIFAGDIFSEETISNVNDDYQKSITEYLDNIEAKYGKFAVLGDIDELQSEYCKDILLEADFELLENTNIKISNSSSEYFNLVGLKPTINNNYDVNEIYQNISTSKFTLTVCHTPDIYSEITDKTNILIAGHTLGGERIFPLLGPIGEKSGYDKYYDGIHSVGDSEIIISSGIGSNSSYRIFAPANIVVLNIENS